MILITGATGMIGRALVSHLGSQGYDIRAHARLPQQLESLFPDGHWAPAERTAAGTPATAKLEPVIADLSYDGYEYLNYCQLKEMPPLIQIPHCDSEHVLQQDESQLLW